MLMKDYKMSVQAKAVLDMKLSKLARLEKSRNRKWEKRIINNYWSIK